jgi:hypothetical protein
MRLGAVLGGMFALSFVSSRAGMRLVGERENGRELATAERMRQRNAKQ